MIKVIYQSADKHDVHQVVLNLTPLERVENELNRLKERQIELDKTFDRVLSKKEKIISKLKEA